MLKRAAWALLVVGVLFGLVCDRLAVMAAAQAVVSDGTFVRDAAGVTWLVVGGKRARVPIAEASAGNVEAIPDSGLWVVPGGDGATRLALGGPPPGAESPVLGREIPDEGFSHAAQDAPLMHQSRPPSSGTHYPTWVQVYGLHDPAPPTGNWLHNLEHGAVAILYNCPSGCPEVVAQLDALYGTLPLGLNARGGRARALIFPYAEMDAKIVAVAWGWLLEQSELNVDEIRSFVEQRIDRGPECRDFRCP